MAPKPDINFKVNISPKLKQYLERNLPNRLQTAREKAVEAAGMVWADEAKEITRNEDHVDTGLYVNSIGYASGGNPPGQPIWEVDSDRDSTTLTVGADVAYASALEKRYSIFARGLDVGKSRMRKVAQTQIEKAIFR